MALWRIRPLRVGYAGVSSPASAVNFSTITLYNDDNIPRLLSLIGYGSGTAAAIAVSWQAGQMSAPASPVRGLPYVTNAPPPPGSLTVSNVAAVPAGTLVMSAITGAQGFTQVQRPIIVIAAGHGITFYGPAINTLINLNLWWQMDDPDILDEVDRTYAKAPS